ncbi:MAG: EAL domain-containing protein [Acidovorax sp.]|nr:EAL domain-containing protein [Acidovorax sp.]
MPDSSTAQDQDGFDARASESLLRLIADAVPASIAYFEEGSLRCRFANERYARSNGHTTASILGKTVREAIGEPAWEVIQPYVQRCLQGEQVQYTRLHTLPDSQQRMIEVNLIPHFDASRLVGAFVLIHDITHHWLAERAVRESEERMRKFSAATEEAIVFHRDGVITDGNEALERLTGYGIPEVRGHMVFDYISPEYRAAAIDYTQSAREDPYEVSILHRDGRPIPVEVVGKTMPINGEDFRIVVVRDITVRKQAQERVAFMALHDTLTQLPNRRYLMEQLGKTLSRARRRHGHAALLFIDLDHFKTVNDSLGHHAGDDLLCEMARRLKSCVRDSDVVARLGGDEFVVVLADLHGPNDAAAVADKLLAAMGAPHTVEGTPVALSPSIGISLFPEDGGEAEELLRHADAAMYHAKDAGRGNRQFYAPGMDGRAPLDVLRQERLLRDAIKEGAFVLHYQPQVRLDDGSLAGFEALVRWRHPERGLVGPDEFIGFAEARGLITPIGRWVMHEACRQLKAWHDEGLPQVPVAVNLSALELRQRDVASEIAAVLQATGLAPRFLEIELTESVLMHQADRVQNTLAALQSLGVGVSVDDFGTGYSSLAYLKRYPIDKLKIDRSFVTDIPGSADDVAIVTAIIQLGRSLQLQTVAEGVETPAQQALLHTLGCDLAQGHGISAPLDAQGTHAWLHARASAAAP